jgi:hypothetical protein
MNLWKRSGLRRGHEKGLEEDVIHYVDEVINYKDSSWCEYYSEQKPIVDCTRRNYKLWNIYMIVRKEMY